MPAGPSFTFLFGGNTLYPAQPTFLSLNPLSASIILQWPFEQASVLPTVAEIIEVNATAGGLTIQLSDARQIGTGYCTLFNNVGANTFTVLDANGGVLAAIPSGTVWELYLADNTTLAGTWRVFQFGAGVSSANAAALAGAGLIAITTTLNQNYVTSVQAANYNSLVGDRAKVIEWTGGTGTITLPVNATLTAGWFTAVKNAGTGNVTVSPTAGTLDGAASLVVAPSQSTFIIYDGANFYTLGFGQTVNSVFDFIQISLAGASGTVVLSGAQLNRVSYRFVGALAGNTTIQVPGTIQQYWVDNETTGAFTLTVSTGGGTTTNVGQTQRNILYCDGVNVVPAVTFGSSGFADGAQASPSIFFTNSPHTGMYSPAVNQWAVTTNSTKRLLIDATGSLVVSQPDTAAGVIINGPLPSGIALKVTQQIQDSVDPALQITSSGAGGLALMSIMCQGGTLGTNDFSLFQLNGGGGPAICKIYNRGAASLVLGANATDMVTVGSTGQVTIAAPSAGAALTVTAQAASNAVSLIGTGAGTEVLRVDNSAGDTRVAIYSAGTEYGLLQATTNALSISAIGATSLMKLLTNAGVAQQIDQTGAIFFPNVGTTASAANAFLNNGSSPANQLLRSTSSKRYKTDIEDIPPAISAEVLELRPIRYRSTAAADDPTLWWYGLVAEDVAEVDPRLVHYTRLLIGEDAQHEPIYGDPVPDGVQYDRVAVLLLAEVQRMRREIDQFKGATQ